MKKIEQAEIVKENPKTCWVRLPDGNIIKRHKRKHMPIFADLEKPVFDGPGKPPPLPNLNQENAGE